MPNRDLQDLRQGIVQAHMDSEGRGDFEATIATGEEHDGAAELRHFYAETSTAFPDFRFENADFHHCVDAVITEVDFVGTHLGAWRGLPATGRKVRYRMCNIFVFDGDKLVCERLHFDLHTVLMQVGIARDPTTMLGQLTTFANHPVHVSAAFLRSLRSR